MGDMTNYPMSQRSIALVGMMGAGKSAIGRGLATRLDLPFYDSDAEIERAAGCKIDDIFREYGEHAFRQSERQIIRRLLNGERCVLATGGGAFMDEGIRGAIGERAISIWLRATVELLYSRVSRRNSRPLLNNGDPRETLIRLTKERNPFYAKANITVDSLDVSKEIVIDRVRAALEDFSGSVDQFSLR